MDAPKPNPAMFTARKGFEKLAEEANKGGHALKKLGESLPQNKEQGPRKPFVRREHLTQRPFHNKDIAMVRDMLRARGTDSKQK